MVREQTRYSRLADITKIINAKIELREVLQYVTCAISEEIVQCHAVGIFLPSEDGKFSAFAGKPESIEGETLDSQVIDPKTDLLAREVIETRKTIYIPDASKDPRPNKRSVEAFKIKSILALPISFEQELFGLVFLFDFGTPMNLSEFQIQSVEAYVNMAAVAIRNAKNFTQKETLIAEKQLLLDATRDLSMCSSIQESLDKCFFYLGKILDSQYMVAYILDPVDKKTIKSAKLRYENDWTEAEWLRNYMNSVMDKYDNSFIRKVIKTKDVYFIPDALADKSIDDEICRRFNVRNLLLIPLISTGEVLGIITVINIERKGHSPQSQIQLAHSIVDATAPTFANLLYMDQLENMVEERTKELAAANEKVTSVIESITDGFFALNKEWEFIYINKHQYLPQGKAAIDVLGKKIWEVFPEARDTVMHKEFCRAMVERIPVQFEIAAPSDDYFHEVVAYPFDEGICCLFKDITEKKKYEKELKRLSSLELIGQMAAGISHEIRNPMTTVRGFLQFLKKDKHNRNQDYYFDLMIEELDRANSIITEFLSIGNTRTSDVQMLDLNSIIYDMAPLIKIDASSQNKSINIITEEIPELLLNRNEIRQLLINLCRNGLEAMSPEKVLTIRTYKDCDHRVILAVQDQGEGIKTEIVEKLGTPFFTTKDNGTGLGLGVCYAIAARHHAEIDIQTGPEGTTFSVRFKY
ncbi:GAF domain-containing sensor histidine kinase [Neobacillus kokaensis]|uniref:histidine kinase n=1 Tax=Neobacillus kokaensis TaxID=2759023 RepID=A0ABQ3NB62_9BACI|nr:GAF domain-containing sensor histidine kinase [Neobacillus kokaensis]GHI01137.1 ATPase [Neobacillus kokaensis]